MCHSHIISESFYTDLYEELHRYSIVAIKKDAKDRYEQKGIREHLLCQDCEQLLGNDYEAYGAEAFRNLKSATKQHVSTFVFDSLDYRQFKLFQLAQLWRIAIAKGPFWQGVVLPKTKLETLRKMLISGNPSTSDFYGVKMEAITNDHGDLFDAFLPPHTIGHQKGSG